MLSSVMFTNTATHTRRESAPCYYLLYSILLTKTGLSSERCLVGFNILHLPRQSNTAVAVAVAAAAAVAHPSQRGGRRRCGESELNRDPPIASECGGQPSGVPFAILRVILCVIRTYVECRNPLPITTCWTREHWPSYSTRIIFATT